MKRNGNSKETGLQIEVRHELQRQGASLEEVEEIVNWYWSVWCLAKSGSIEEAVTRALLRHREKK